MHWEYRLRYLDNVEYRGAHVYEGIVEAEDKCQAFLNVCEKEHCQLYCDGKWMGCYEKDEEETKKALAEGTMQLHTDNDWDLEFDIEHVDKNEAYEAIEIVTFKRHICKFEIRLPIEKEDPSVDVKCKLKIWAIHDDLIIDSIVNVDFENNKLLWPISNTPGWKGSGKPIDDEHEYDNIDEVLKIVREFLASL